MKNKNISLKRAGCNFIPLFIFLLIFIIISSFIEYELKKSTSRKADAIISSYCEKVKEDKYLTSSTKAELTNDLLKIGFDDVKIIAPEKEAQDKNISLNVEAKCYNSMGGIAYKQSYLKKININ